jgi:hypothetical protein
MSDWLACLATDRGVTCDAHRGEVLFSRQHTFGTPVGHEKVNNDEACED